MVDALQTYLGLMNPYQVGPQTSWREGGRQGGRGGLIIYSRGTVQIRKLCALKTRLPRNTQTTFLPPSDPAH